MDTEAVRRAVIAKLSDHQPGFDCRISEPAIITRNAVIYRGECPGKHGSIAIKCARDGSASDQFTALTKANRVMNTGGEFSVPRPIAALGDEQIIIMEWIDANSLSKVLTRSSSPIHQLASCVNRAGRWLARFHGCEGRTYARFPAEERLEYLRDEVHLAGLVDNRLMRDSLRLMRNSAHVAGRHLVAHGVVHGDFKPDNILVSAGRTVGIDFQMRHGGHVIADVTNFVTYLLLMTYEPRALAVGLFRHRKRLVTDFLDGYQAEGDCLPSLPLAWYRLHNMLRMWTTQQRNEAGGARTVYLIRCICHEVVRCRNGLRLAVSQAAEQAHS